MPSFSQPARSECEPVAMGTLDNEDLKARLPQGFSIRPNGTEWGGHEPGDHLVNSTSMLPLPPPPPRLCSE